MPSFLTSIIAYIQVLINLVALPQETLTAKLTGVALPQEWSPRVEHPLTSDLIL